MKNPTFTVIMPVYNTQKYVRQALQSVLDQTCKDFELLIIDDQGTDHSIPICRNFSDSRIKIITQKNRGLAGARNTGIRHANGRYIAFLDSDDFWHPEKLALHKSHLNSSTDVGISYAASRMIAEDGTWLALTQKPKLTRINPAHVYLRNPIGNGSAAVIRREVLDEISYQGSRDAELDYFDETFRQSEDIECWMRIALTTHWRFEGIPGELTYYRINESGLSANVIRQYEAWLRVRDIVRSTAPNFATRYEGAAEAYQLRYLARRSVRMGEQGLALKLILQALSKHPRIALAEPVKTITTFGAALCLRCMPAKAFSSLQKHFVGA